MGMLDYYEPKPDLICPRCGRALADWQGKDGDNALFVWKQGIRHPTSQSVDEEYSLTAEELSRFSLPQEFTMLTNCSCSTKFLFDAVGTSIDGIWSSTKLINADDIESFYGHLPRTRRKAIRQWLRERI